MTKNLFIIYVYTLYAILCNLFIAQHCEPEKTLECESNNIYIAPFRNVEEVEKAWYTCHECLHLSDYSFTFLLRNKWNGDIHRVHILFILVDGGIQSIICNKYTLACIYPCFSFEFSILKRKKFVFDVFLHIFIYFFYIF